MATINKAEILTALKADLQAAEPYHDTWKKRRIQWIKEYDGEPYGNERKDKSTIVSRDIKNAAAWQHAAIIDPFVSGNEIAICSPVTNGDVQAANQAQILLNYQFCRDHRFKRYNFISQGFKVLQREGTVIARVGWDFQEKEVEVDVPEFGFKPMMTPNGYQFVRVQTGTRKEMQMKTIVNRPTAEICNNNTIYMDPTAENDIDECEFVIYKYKSNYRKLDAAGIYSDLEKIMPDSDKDEDDSDIQYDSRDTSFKFKDAMRKELDVYEYWGNFDIDGTGVAEPMVCVWVNSTVIRLEKNPYPGGFLPFVSCAYDSDPFSINGKANADLIGTDQKVKTGIKRAVLDTLDASTNTQKGTPKGMLDPLNARRFKAGEDFEFNAGTANDIWMGKFADIPSSVLAFYNLVGSEIESLSGYKGNNSQAAGAAGLDSKAGSMPGANDAAGKREVDISRNFKENLLIPVLRKWLAMDMIFLDEEEVVRITEEEFVTVRRDDIQGEIDIDMDVATAAVNAEKSAELSFMLQTIGPKVDLGLQKIMLTKISKLKQMPDLAMEIANYNPQPNPLEQEKMQLEIEKLRAEIAERNSRANENGVDIRLKEAKASSEEARARKVHSEADLSDLDFLKEQSGENRQQQVQDKMIDYSTNRELKRMQL